MQTNKILGTLLVVASLTSCAKFSGISNPAYLQDHYHGSASAEKVRENLKRYNYEVSAYPLTGAYIEADIQEQSVKEGLNQAQTQQRIANTKGKLKIMRVS